MPLPKITLDQWAALVEVVEQGGYAQASRRLIEILREQVAAAAPTRVT